MRTWISTLAMAAMAASLSAQDHVHQGAETRVQESRLPAGWQARLDRPNASLSNVNFARKGDGYHVRLGPSGIFYNPQHAVEGAFTAQARFTQVAATAHPEAYGLLIGGQDLEGPDQDYLYFLIRQDGRFLVKHRAGNETHTIQDWTEHPAVVPVAAGGATTNELSVEAGPRRARFLVNGVEVAKFENVEYLNTAGIVGLRINHNLELHIEDYRVVPDR